MSKPVILKEKDDYIIAIRKKDGVAVQNNCDQDLDLLYCFAAVTAAIKDHYKRNDSLVLIEMLPKVVDSVLEDNTNFPLNVEIEE